MNNAIGYNALFLNTAIAVGYDALRPPLPCVILCELCPVYHQYTVLGLPFKLDDNAVCYMYWFDSKISITFFDEEKFFLHRINMASSVSIYRSTGPKWFELFKAFKINGFQDIFENIIQLYIPLQLKWAEKS